MILAFDIATRCGVCWGDPCGRPQSCTVDLGRSEAQGERFARAIRMTAHFVGSAEPDLVVIEAPASGDFGSNFLIGLAACVEGEARRLGAPVLSYFPNTVRKYFLGKSLTTRDFPGKSRAQAKGAIKAAVIARCHALGWMPKDGDAADAVALWSYACSLASRDHIIPPPGGLFQEAQNVPR